MRALFIISGVILTVTGVFCFVNPDKTWATFAFIIGIVTIIHGFGGFIAFLLDGRKRQGSGLVLAEGLISIAVGILALLYPFEIDLLITCVFGVWTLMTGIFRIVAAFDMNGLGKNVLFVFLVGILGVVAGVYGFVHPYIAYMGLPGLLGIFFVMQGVGTLVMGISLPVSKR